MFSKIFRKSKEKEAGENKFKIIIPAIPKEAINISSTNCSIDIPIPDTSVYNLEKKVQEIESIIKHFGIEELQNKNKKLEESVEFLQNQVKISQSLLLKLEKEIQTIEDISVEEYRTKIKNLKQEFLNQANNEIT